MKTTYISPSVEVMQVKAYALLNNVSAGDIKGIHQGSVPDPIEIY